MSVNDAARPALRETIEDLDEALYRLCGCIHALRLLSEDFGTHTAEPVSSAFWAIIAAADGFIAQSQSSSGTIHEISTGRCKA